MIYGNKFLPEQMSDSFISVSESAQMYLTEWIFKDIFKKTKVPESLKINEDDIINASKFKSKADKLIKYMKDEEWPENKISNSVLMLYYSVIGATFGSEKQKDKKYQPKLKYIVSIVKANCNEKHQQRVFKDMQETIDTLEKMKSNGKELNDLQKGWLADLKSVASSIK